jgi:membrane protein DedA with SNARE-associated domain
VGGLVLLEHDHRPAPSSEGPCAGRTHDPGTYHRCVDPLHPVRLWLVEPSRAKPVTRRRELAMFAVPMIILAIGANVGNALAPTLLTDEPAVLLTLAPRLRWLLLSSPNLNALEFYGIPFIRAAAVLSLYYFFGRRYGDAALKWAEDRAGRSMRPVRWIERQFHRGRYPLVVFFPGTLAAMLGGADRMPYGAFISVALVATAVRLALIRVLAQAIEGTLLDILDWVGKNQLWLTVASFVGVFAYVLWTNRSSTAPIESVEAIAEELDEAAAEVGEPDPV